MDSVESTFPNKAKVKVILRPTVSRLVCLRVRHPSAPHDQIVITVRQLQVCQCGAPSLTRRHVCGLQLLLRLVSAFILESEYRGTQDHILLPQIRNPPNLEDQIPIFTSPKNKVVQLYSPGTGFLFNRLLRLTGLRWRYSTCIHTENISIVATHTCITDRIENAASQLLYCCV
jgi:hypothetical protein